jgi:Methyltransferase FkbM domain
MGTLKKIIFKFLNITGHEVLNLNLFRQISSDSTSFEFERYVYIISKKELRLESSSTEADFFKQALVYLQTTRPGLFEKYFALYISGSCLAGFYVQFKDGEAQYLSNTASPEKEIQIKQILSNPQMTWKLDPLVSKQKSAAFSFSYILYATYKGMFDAGSTLNELKFFQYALPLLPQSKSQIFQDVFAMYCNKGNGSKFFVEFGATDGYSLSNSWMLEKFFSWNGILCEPGRTWHHKLKANRSCVIDERCVWSKTGEVLTFNEAEVAELSTIEHFNNLDHHSEERKNGLVYDVDTISLNELLDFHNAPHEIHYMSVDTEGSEFEILSSFDFTKHTVNVLSVEHNFTENRQAIYELLTKNGFERVFPTLSRFDDWYVRRELVQNLN